MWVNPFIIGILSTIDIEMLIFIGLILYIGFHNDDKGE